jgi:hypothetical protein
MPYFKPFHVARESTPNRFGGRAQTVVRRCTGTGFAVTGHHSKIAAFTVCDHPRVQVKLSSEWPACTIHNESREN